MSTKTQSLTLAKASQDDIDSTLNFLKALQVISEHPFKLEDYESDEYIYPTLKSFCTYVPEYDEKPKLPNEKHLHLDNILFEFEKNVSHKFWRVIIGADTLIRNVCDPKESHLAYHPKFTEPTELLCEIDEYLENNPDKGIVKGSDLHNKIKNLVSYEE